MRERSACNWQSGVQARHRFAQLSLKTAPTLAGHSGLRPEPVQIFCRHRRSLPGFRLEAHPRLQFDAATSSCASSAFCPATVSQGSDAIERARGSGNGVPHVHHVYHVRGFAAAP